MTEQEIEQRAEEYANKVNAFAEDESVYFAAKDGYVSGAHISDEEIKHLEEQLERTSRDMIAYKTQVEKLRYPWISVKERLPEKKDGKIRSDLLLVTLGQYWTAAEYHFGDKRWINMLGERETIEPDYWQEVNLPEDHQ